jgi:hypothetical protein
VMMILRLKGAFLPNIVIPPLIENAYNAYNAYNEKTKT